MKKGIMHVISAVIIIGMILMLNISYSWASSGQGLIYVGKNCQMYVAEEAVTRSGNAATVYVIAQSVFPMGPSYDEDNYTKCKVVFSEYGNTQHQISDIYTLVEGTDYFLGFREGYQNTRTFDIQFSGNNPSCDARIFYIYNGR